MVKRKKQKCVVGANNIVRTAIPKPTEKLILEFQAHLQKNSKKKISKQWAALQLTIELDKNKWW